MHRISNEAADASLGNRSVCVIMEAASDPAFQEKLFLVATKLLVRKLMLYKGNAADSCNKFRKCSETAVIF